MTNKIFSILGSLALLALTQSAIAGDSYSCLVKSNDGKRFIPVTLTPTGTRSGTGAYEIRTADFELPEAAKPLVHIDYENNPINTNVRGVGEVFVMEEKSRTDTASEFRVKFGYRYGFFSTQAEKSEIYVNKSTGAGYFHADIRNAFSFTHDKTDLEFSACKPLVGTWYDGLTEAKLWIDADASAQKQLGYAISPAELVAAQKLDSQTPAQ